MEEKHIQIGKNLELSYKMVRLAIFAITFAVIIFGIALQRCGKNPPEPISQIPGGEDNAELCSDGLKVGDTKTVACTAPKVGEQIFVCKAEGKPSELVNDGCKSPEETCNKVTFEENLKPLLAAQCADCHAVFVNYDVAVQRIDEWIRRVDLAAEDPRRMPKKPKPELSQFEKDFFINWKRDGLIKTNKECQGTNQGSTMTLDDIETILLTDISKIEQSDREFVRYFISSHKLNEGQSTPLGKGAVDKALNSLVEKSRVISLSTFIDPKKTILRFDLRSFELDARDWGFIEQFDRINFVSNTDKGKSLRLITKTQKPWLHFDNGIDLLSDPALYYFFLNVPKYIGDLRLKLGVNYANDLRNLDATLIGNNDSILTNQRNRLLSRHESIDGYYWETYDTGALGSDRQKNLFDFPLLRETGSARIFRSVASEVIASLPNGLQMYALYNGNGELQKIAPIDVVRDQQSPVPPAPAIQTSISCQRCHFGGIITARDEIRQHVIDHGDEFGTNDVERVKSLYKTQVSLNAIFKVDNSRYAEALKKVGVTVGDKDPINRWRDELYLNWDDKKTAAFLFLPLAEFREKLNQSAEGRRQIGQLLSGGTVTFDQLKSVLPILRRDMRIGEDEINGN